MAERKIGNEECSVYGKHDLRIEDYPMPKAGAHDIVIQVKACGVCGTDVHIYDGDKGRRK